MKKITILLFALAVLDQGAVLIVNLKISAIFRCSRKLNGCSTKRY